MDKQPFPNAQKDFVLLAEAGFIALNQGDEDAAMKLFAASELLNPENALPRIGMGYLHFLKLELKQAGKIFEDVIAKDPGNEMASALLGLSLALGPTDTIKGEKMLENIAKNAKDPNVKNMALTATEFVEKFIKKPSSLAPETKPKKKKK